MTKYGHGTPVLLFHGWGFNQSIWTGLLPKLTHKYTVYLVDLPGFGTSKYQDWQNFKLSLLSLLPPKFALLGWSMGGLYATRLALEEPDRVSCLFNIASSPHFLASKSWPGILPQAFQKFYQQLQHNPQKMLTDFIELQLPDNNCHSKQYIGAPPDIQGLKAGLDTLLNWDFRDKIMQLTIPVCYSFGRLDSIVPYKTLSVMNTRYPEFNYVSFRCSAHAPFLSEDTLFLSELEAFIQ